MGKSAVAVSPGLPKHERKQVDSRARGRVRCVLDPWCRLASPTCSLSVVSSWGMSVLGPLQMLEVHYENEGRLEGLVDSTGFEVRSTTTSSSLSLVLASLSFGCGGLTRPMSL